MRARKKDVNMGRYLAVFLSAGAVLASRFSIRFTQEQVRLYIALMMAYAWIGILLLYARMYYDLYVFEPLSFVSAIYISVFIVKPLIDLRAGHMIEHSVDVSGGGLKATLILILGYTALYIGYYLNYDASGRHDLSQLPDVESGEEYDPFSLYIVWGITFGLCLLCMFSQGLSLRYIFSLGKTGEVTVSESNTALLFLSNFVVTMYTVWMLILFRTPGWAGKLLISILTAVYLIMRNSRWLILAFILGPVTYLYVKNRKRPRGIYLLQIAIVGILLFAWMQANRAVLASGGAVQGWGKGGLTLEKLAAPFESNLNTYRAFFAMVNRYPSRYPYLLGASYYYVFIMFVPRVLWKGKPDNPCRKIIEHALNGQARRSGTAVSTIGESYVNFGVAGCILIMFLIGRLLAFLKTFILSAKEDDLILYSVMFPLLFQWIARGNFSGNFFMTVFAVLPFIGKKYLYRRSNGRTSRVTAWYQPGFRRKL